MQSAIDCTCLQVCWPEDRGIRRAPAGDPHQGQRHYQRGRRGLLPGEHCATPKLSLTVPSCARFPTHWARSATTTTTTGPPGCWPPPRWGTCSAPGTSPRSSATGRPSRTRCTKPWLVEFLRCQRNQRISLLTMALRRRPPTPGACTWTGWRSRTWGCPSSCSAPWPPRQRPPVRRGPRWRGCWRC